MLQRGLARKVTIHLNEDTSSDRGLIYEQVFQFLYDQGIAGATLIRPQEGFGVHHHRHAQEGHGAAKRHLPVRIEFIDSPGTIDQILPALCDLVLDGLVEVQGTTIVKAATQEASF